MDKVVSNAGPLIHLTEIGEFELLNTFSRIYIPEKVYEEVCIEGMPGEREVRSARFKGTKAIKPFVDRYESL